MLQGEGWEHGLAARFAENLGANRPSRDEAISIFSSGALAGLALEAGGLPLRLRDSLFAAATWVRVGWRADLHFVKRKTLYAQVTVDAYMHGILPASLVRAFSLAFLSPSQMAA